MCDCGQMRQQEWMRSWTLCRLPGTEGIPQNPQWPPYGPRSPSSQAHSQDPELQLPPP